MGKQFWTAIFAVMALGLASYGCDFLSSNESSGKGASKKAQSKLHVPDPKNIVTDEETGLKVEQDVILINFSPFVDEPRRQRW